MGTACNVDRRIVKLTTIAVMVLASAWYAFAPVFVLAQEAAPAEQTCGENIKQPKCNALCWEKEQCGKEKGRWEQNKASDAECGGSPWGYCYPPNREVTLQVPIGEAKDVADVGRYIKTVYLFLLGIGGLVGAIVLIHAGFLWLVSGGNTGTIERAKKHIQDAAIGLLLLFGSYTILSAINPDLVRLHVPKAQLLRNVALEFEKTKKMQPFDKCDAADPRSVSACKEACQGCDCRKENVPPMVRAIQVVQVAQMLVVGGLVLAEAPAVAQVGVKALNAVGKGMSFVFKQAFSLCSKGLQLAVLCGLGANAGIDTLAATFNKEEAYCVKYQSNAPNGVTCAKDEECASKKCLLTQTLAGYGLCADGKEGSPCLEVSDCKILGTVCADGPNDSKWCTTIIDRLKGSPCHAEEDGGVITSECGLGLSCKVQEGDVFTFSTKEGIGWCVSDADLAVEAARGSGPDSFKPRFIGDACQSAQGICPGEPQGLTLGYGLQCASGVCTKACDQSLDCTAQFGCPPGKECSCVNSRCIVGVQEQQVLANGFFGCENAAKYKCADGLKCVGPIPVNVEHHSICTNGDLGSGCTNADECDAGLACDEDPAVGTFTCIRE